MIFIIAVTFFGADDIAYCDDASRILKTFRGTVEEIDWVGSLITVMGADEITFFVPSDTRIINQTETISLSGIELSDEVLIKYYDDPSGTPKTVSITVEDAYPSF